MTPQLDRLREIETERAAHVDALAQLADEAASIIKGMNTQPEPSASARRPGHGRAINICVAERISGMSRTWIYSLARRRPDIGWKTETAGWRFDEAALRAIFDKPPRAKSAICAESADEIISRTHSPV